MVAVLYPVPRTLGAVAFSFFSGLLYLFYKEIACMSNCAAIHTLQLEEFINEDNRLQQLGGF
jgi:hypothetical protein